MPLLLRFSAAFLPRNLPLRRPHPRRTLASTSVQHSTVSLPHLEFGSNTQSSQSTEKPLVLFLHGLLGNKRNFASIGRSLAAQSPERRFIGLDLRNHGDAAHDGRAEMTYISMAHDVMAWCAQHSPGRPVELIGHSVGGKVAQLRWLVVSAFAFDCVTWKPVTHRLLSLTRRAVALLEPTLVQGLVVLDIAPVVYSDAEPHWSAVTEIIHALLRVPLTTRRADVDQQLRAHIPDANLRAFCLTNVDWATGEWKIPLQQIAQQLEALAGFDVPASTRPYTGDAFFIHGGQSKFVRSSHLPRIQEFFPNHMLTTIRGAGHWVHAEAPEDTAALIQRFLQR